MTTRTRRSRRGEEGADVVELFGFDDAAPVAPTAARTKDGWPVDVPVLVESDVIWNYSTGRGRRDLLVWLEATFNPEYPAKDAKQFRTAYETLCAVLTERFRRPVKCLWLFLEFAKKHRLPCLAWQAACWNEMLSRLGYAVPKKSTKDPGFRNDKEK